MITSEEMQLRRAWETPFLAGLDWLGMTVSSAQEEALFQYFLLLRLWNQKINLTSLEEPDEVAVKHFIDSLTCLKVDFPLGAEVLDVGTGAGFPGLVLKIVRPDLQITLLDATEKKVGFLREVISALELSGVEPLHGRAEELGREPGRRERYQRVVSRAVAEMRTLLEYTLPLTKVPGLFIAQKGPKGEDELRVSKQALGVLGGGNPQVLHFKLPLQDEERLLIITPKEKHTPQIYPRRTGIPAKKPL